MKPDCQQVLTQFASFSVEELSDSEAATLLHHLEECEPCKGQWLLFEKSLTVVTQSGPRDEDVEQHRSQQMWLVCMEHARHKAEKKPTLAAPTTRANKVHAHGEIHAEENAQSGSVLTVPRIGMTLVGGALLMLTSSYALAATPANHAAPTPKVIAETALVDYNATLKFVTSAKHSAPSKVAAPTKNWVAKAVYQIR